MSLRVRVEVIYELTRGGGLARTYEVPQVPTERDQAKATVLEIERWLWEQIRCELDGETVDR